MKADQLKEVLRLHKLWLQDDSAGKRADLRANLIRADLRGADLRGADLRGVDLRGANLHCANLHCADLRGTDLRGVDLYSADLHGATISEGVTAKRLIARATRLCDGYEGFLFETETGEFFGRFGCRAMSLDDFEKHVEAYADNDPRKGQSEDIIAYFRAVAATLAIPLG